jgi:chemotaxis protein histidine kinase CheA
VPIDPLLREVVANFIGESRELSASATRDLLTIEKGAAAPEMRAAWDRLARGLHTLKGSAATLGLEDLSALAHALEDLVRAPRTAYAQLASDTTDVVLKSLDVFNHRLKAHVDGVEVSDIKELLAKIPKGVAPAAPQAPKPLEPQPNKPDGQKAEAKSDAAQTEEVSDAWRVTSGQVMALMRELERLREMRLRLDERRRVLTRAASSRIDEAEARAIMASVAKALGNDAAEAVATVDALEDEVKAISALPLRTLLEPLQRSVRDLCRATGKLAELSTVGSEISLDRRVLDALKGPLTHLVRNAVDHGVETPAQRKARGKHEEGAIVVSAEQQGNLVFIEVSDDGGGLDTERIRAKAFDLGLFPQDVLASMDTQQVNQLVFASGLSTRDEVSETSGRGVGLDVVRAKVQALEGNVEVHSTPGQGTRMFLSVPTDLGSSPVLMVRVGEHRFGLPMMSVEGVIAAGRADIRVTRNEMRLLHHDQLLPLVDLGGLLALRQSEPPTPDAPVLFVHAAGQRVAVAVDEVIGDRDLVIRALPGEVRSIAAYQGASSLADGDLLLVLRPVYLTGAAREDAAIAAPRRALVVDDSLTARALHRTMLESGGYAVHAVSSGEHALEQLKRSAYDVVVCDVSMEGMSGLDLAQTVRRSSALRGLPLVLVSMNDQPQDKENALQAGADVFLSKKDCVAGRLLGAVAEAMTARQHK